MRKAFWALGILWVSLIVGFAYAGEENSDLFLGVYVDEVTSEISDDYGVKAGEGVLVTGTVDGSPADVVGLRDNDILLKLDGATLTGPAELRHQIQQHKQGDKVALTYKRGGKTKTVDIELVERDSGESMFLGDNFEWHSGPDKRMKIHVPNVAFGTEDEDVAFAGLVTQELSEGLQGYFKVDHGALISEVVKDSPAEKAGLKSGDIVIKIGTRDIDDTDDVRKAIRKYEPDEEVDFVVMRDGVEKSFKVKLTSREEYYGSSDAPDRRFGLAGKEVDGFILMPDGGMYDLAEGLERLKALEDLEGLESLEKEMERLNWDIESLPDVRMDLSIDPANPIIEMNFDEARAIRNDSWWKRSWNEMKTKLESEFEELKENFEQLKQELKQLQEEFKQKML